MTTRILGVLGGMGPLASAQFMLRLTLLTPAGSDQEHIPAVLWSDPRVPDRTAARLTAGADPLPALIRGLRGLQAAGCGAVVIPCNTAHAWLDDMRDATSLPILSIIDCAIAELRRLGVRPGATVGVMGTAATLGMRLYQDRLEALGYATLQPSADEMTGLVDPAVAAVKANRVEAAHAPLAQAIERLKDGGASAVVLGCTEIPVGIRTGAGEELGIQLVDTIDALARSSIEWARQLPAAFPSTFHGAD